jgi:DNA polymerase-3 subunit delta
MQLRFNQLASQLSRELAPVYLLHGDEPYQLGEAARLIREQARRKGFDEREILDVDGHFDWNLLPASAEAMSLFSARKLIELRIGSGKLGKDGGAAIRAYCERPCPDNLLLILAPGLERKDLQAQWAKTVEALGVLVQVWPLKEKELETWLGQRLLAVGFQAGAGVAALLAERAEGNLLAAVQEIEKLRLLHETGPLTLDDLLGNLADSARFDLFALTDAAIAGDRARVQRVLAALRGEGIADALVLWVLARELRMLADVAAAIARRTSPESVFMTHRVPRPRQEGIARALRRLSPDLIQRLLQQCLLADLSIKGMTHDDSWQLLAIIADALSAGGFAMPMNDQP